MVNQMAIDEELLKPSREHLAMLKAEIQRQHDLAVSDIERYGYGDREYARNRWDEYHMNVVPMRREIEAVVKVITDYCTLQPMPPMIVRKLGH
jgi:hypothetical protein